jgi:transposase
MSGKKPGRPTKEQELLTFEIMVKCFGDGLSAPAAAKKAGVNLKTAYSHYETITNQYKENSIDGLFERQENDRIQIIASFDKDIEEASEVLDQIRTDKKWYLDKHKPIPKHLFILEIDMMKYRSTIKDRKAGYVIRPTAQEEYGREIAENSEVMDGKT